MTIQPFSFGQAFDAADAASKSQEEAEDTQREDGKTAARAEEEYRKALALEIFRLQASGVAWTVCGDLARGNEKVAALKATRDIAASTYEASKSALWRHAHDRKDVGRFVEWSMRRELAEGYAATPDDDDSRLPIFGSRHT